MSFIFTKIESSSKIKIPNEVKEIVSEGVEFDPTVHQAVLMEHDENKPQGVVLEVLQKGYKYKDKVFEFSDDHGRKAIFSFKAENEKGVLSSILNGIAEFGGNVLTINQDMPIHNLAYVTITIDTKDLSLPVYDLMGKLKKIQRIKKIN